MKAPRWEIAVTSDLLSLQVTRANGVMNIARALFEQHFTGYEDQVLEWPTMKEREREREREKVIEREGKREEERERENEWNFEDEKNEFILNVTTQLFSGVVR